MKDKEFIFGTHAVLEALKAGKSIDKIHISREAKSEQLREIKIIAKKNSVYYQLVPGEKLNRITGKNHQGIIAWMSPVDFCKIETLLPGLFEKGINPFVIVLDGVTDVRNFGAVVRTAECAGAHAVVVPEKGASRINADAMKTSAGALNRMPVCKAGILSGTVKFLSESGLYICGLSEKTNTNYYSIDLDKPLALVMGSEETGISSGIIKKLDCLAYLPMKGKISSLNVSVAAGIAMFEVLRQRK